MDAVQHLIRTAHARGASVCAPRLSSVRSAWLRTIFTGLCLLLGGAVAHGQTVTATLNAGKLPIAAAANPLTNKAYIANQNSNTVTIINGLTNSTTTVTVGTSPSAVAVDPTTNLVYVANNGSSNVSVISGSTDSVTQTITVGSGPAAIAVNSITKLAYVANKTAGTVTVIDETGVNGPATVTVGSQPTAVAVNEVTDEIYVANFSGGTVSVVNGSNNSVSTTVSVGAGPTAVAVNAATNKIYVANYSGGTVSIINGSNNTITATPTTGTNPNSIAVDPVTNKIYVANFGSANITVIDGSSNAATNLATASGTTNAAIAVDPLTNQVYVASQGTNAVTVINGANGANPASVAVSLGAGTNPKAIAVNPVTNRIYVANQGLATTTSTVTVLDGATNATTTTSTGGAPVMVAVNPITNQIYVANSSSGTVTAIDGNGVNPPATITVQSDPSAVAVNPRTNLVYVANTLSKSVSVIDGSTNTFVKNITVGNYPVAVAVNPVTNKIYVVTQVDGNAVILDGTGTNSPVTVGLGSNPQAVAVNTYTNQAYFAVGNNTLVIMDGANNPTVVPAGNSPIAVAVNQVTNKIYVANFYGNTVTMVDGNNGNASTTINVGSEPLSIGVNPQTNKIYVANSNDGTVSIIDGTQNTTASTTSVTVGQNPWSVAVNTETNKIYVSNSANTGGVSKVSVIDGSTGSINNIPTGNQSVSVAINPITNDIYVANQNTNNVTAIAEQQLQTFALTATVQPLTGNTTSSLSPSFTVTATNTLTSASANGVFYQVDSWQGAWSAATNQGGGSFSAALSALQPGYHVLYAFATAGEAGMTANGGLENSPLVSNIAAYSFLIAPTGASLTPSTLNFGDQEATTIGTAQNATLTNMGAAPLTFTISNTDAYEFPESNTDSCHTAGGTLAVGASCTISIAFAPQIPTGAKNATLTVTDNSNGVPGSTQTISLSGTATGNVDPGVVWSAPAPINYGTALSSTQLNATATPPGTFVYTPAAGTVLGAGTHTLSVTFTPNDTTTYAPSTKTVQITVNPGVITVTANSLSRAYANANPAFTARYTGFVNNDTVSVLSGLPALSTSATTTSQVGNYSIVAAAGNLAAANYTFVFANGTLTVTQATPAITWPTPSQINSATPLSATQLDATSVVAGTFSYTPASGTLLTAGTQTLSVLFTPTDAIDYTTTTATVQLIVVTTPTITWTNPAPITYGTALSSAQLNATASVPGSFIYTPSAGTVLGAGTNTLSVQFIPTDTVHYISTTASVQLTVNQAPPNSQATVTTTIPVGTHPKAIAVNPVTNKTYVTNVGSGTVSVIDGATNNVTPITVGNQPDAVAVNPDTNQIYVANYNDGTVSVIDGGSNTVTSTITVGTSPTGVAVNSILNQVYVVNDGSNSVSVFSGATSTTQATLLGTVTVGTNPFAVAVNPVTGLAYVSNQGSNSVSVIDGANPTVVKTTISNVGANPYSVSVNAATNKVYVTNLNGGTVAVIDPTNGNAITPVTVGTSPWAVAVNPVTNKTYVANYGSGSVTVIDGKNNYATTPVTVGTNPNAITVNTLTNQVYVANLGSANFTVIDGASNTPTTVAVGNTPDAVAVNTVTDKIYFANNGSNSVSVVDGATNTTTTISAASYPSAVAVNSITNNVYVVNNGSNSVTVITGSTTTSVPVGTSPSAVAVNPLTNKIYVVDSNQITLIDGATNATTPITVGHAPNAVAVNPVTNKIYVSNYVDGTVSVVDGSTNAVTATTGVGKYPNAVAVNPATNRIYVTGSGDKSLTVIDGSTDTAIASVTVGDAPFALAVNPITNKIYVANSNLDSYPTPGTVSVVDGVTNAVTTINAGVEPFAIDVNPVTNMIYAVNKDGNSILAINGANNATTTLSVGSFPFAVAVNPVTNKIYVPNAGSVGGNYYISVIDGATNFITTLSAGSQPAGVAVNPMTNQVYIVNNLSSNVTALTEQQVQTIPVTTTIQPLPGNETLSLAPAFNFTAANSLTGGAVNGVFYQVDSWQGTWKAATNHGSGSFAASLAALQPGYHVLYAYATEGEEAMSTVSGSQNSPLVGNIASYGFTIVAQISGGGANVSPSSLTFPGQAKTTTSPAQTVTLVNASNAVLTFSISISGTNNGDFAETLNADTCSTLGGQLAANSSCTIGVKFTPAGTGTRTATLTVTDNSNGIAGSTQTVSLTGTGTGNLSPGLAWTAPTSITYGTPLGGGQLDATATVPGTFTYTPAAGTVLNAGMQTLSVQFTPQDTSNYAAATTTVQITVLPATLTVSATNATRQYQQANPAFTANFVGFVNNDTSAVLTGTPSFSTTASLSSPVGSYAITVAKGTLAASNYTFSFATGGNLTVTAATTTINWGPLAPITIGTALGAGQLNATATIAGGTSVTGTFVYTPAAGAVLSSGTQTLSVSFTPTGPNSADFTSATGTTTLQVNQATAVFSNTDTTSKGNWIGIYGGDGYSYTPTYQSLPGYATFQVQNAAEYTWTGTDGRALQTPDGSSRVAATWYNATTFSFDVNITDGHTHQIALYALDWEALGRAETIAIVDAVTNNTLDTENISGFSNGTYLIWNISGHVKINVTATSSNAVVSGVFFGGSSGTESVSVSPAIINLMGGGSQQFAATIHNGASQPITWAISNVSPTGAAQGTLSSTGFYNAPTTVSVTTTVTVKATTQDGLTSGTSTVTLNPPGTGTSGTTATFVPPADTTTEGTWKGVYGADGYDIANVGASLPSYAAVGPSGATLYTWDGASSDPRALQTPTGTGRMATTWFTPITFNFTVSLSDGNAHQVALYAVDWDGGGRAETIQITDAVSGTVLDSRNISNFGNGVWLVWNISGNVKFTVTATAGNAVVSGIFFAPTTGSTGGGGPETVTVSPTSKSLLGGGSQQFTATVLNGTGTPTWSITNVSPSGAAQGTLSSTGLYNAPTTVTVTTTLTVKATAADGLASGTATVTLNPPATGTGGTSVTYVAPADTTTSGSWKGVYGADGYDIANVGASLPSYAAVGAPGATLYTWDGASTDPRALQLPTGMGRMATTWFDPITFNFTVSFNDGNAHQVALYAVDWDQKGRAETIQITDAVSGGVLDSRSISNFGNGVWVVWNISGSVKFTVTATASNAVVSGIFFAPTTGSTGGGGPETVTVSPTSKSLLGGGSQQFTATVTNGTGTPTWSITNVSPSGAAQGTLSSSGLYNAPTTVTVTTTLTVKATAADGLASGTATVTLNPPATGTGGTVVTFMNTDTTASGTWKGVYGADGYDIANVGASLPGYATVGAPAATLYTWSSPTTDTRALQLPNGTGRAATTWFDPITFNFTVSFNDSNTHQVALYAVDWDQKGRAETIQITDAVSGVVLDSRSISNFGNGVWVVWNISGSVKFTVTATAGNAVVSGIFFAPTTGSSGGPETVTVSPTSKSLLGGGSQQFTATVLNGTGTPTWSITNVSPSGAAQGTLSSTGLYNAPTTVTVTTTLTVKATAADGLASGTATVTLNPPGTGTAGTSATFVSMDATTQGNWKGVYGADGYELVNIAANPSSYATFSVNGFTYTWNGATTDPRALELPSGTGRLAAAWYSPVMFNINLAFNDGNTHQVAFYAVDWDPNGRSETIQVTDAVSGVVLDSRTISNFSNGVYLIWNISGSVKVNITPNVSNAVISGVFFH